MSPTINRSLTETEKKALQFLFSGPKGPAEFARFMWPDSRYWKNYSRVGNGVAMGVGMPRAGGSYLSKLRAKGLVWRDSSTRTYGLTSKGKHAVTDADD